MTVVGKTWRSLSRLTKKLLRNVSNPFSNSYRSLKLRRTLRRIEKQQGKLSLRLQSLDNYLASLPEAQHEPKDTPHILARAEMFNHLVSTPGWQDLAARTNLIVKGLRRDLERNPFDPKTGRDRSDELRAMLFGITRVLDIPNRSIESARQVNEAIRRMANRRQ